MVFVRLVNPANFDRRKNRFQNYVFKNSSEDGGASVFDFECARATSGDVCAHIKEFYGDVGGEPPAFWVFELSAIQPANGKPKAVVCRQKDSKSGDKCHHNVEDATNGHLRRIAENWRIEDLMICAEDGVRHLSIRDIPEASAGVP